MSELTIEIPTGLKSMERARPLIERELQGLFPAGLLDSRWEGDTLHMQGPGASATVVLEAGQLVGRATLRPPASMMRAMIEEKVTSALQRVAAHVEDV